MTDSHVRDNTDRQIRDMEQEAGLDRDLESQVPPRYDLFSIAVLVALLVLAVMFLIWLVI